MFKTRTELGLTPQVTNSDFSQVAANAVKKTDRGMVLCISPEISYFVYAGNCYRYGVAIVMTRVDDRTSIVYSIANAIAFGSRLFHSIKPLIA